MKRKGIMTLLIFFTVLTVNADQLPELRETELQRVEERCNDTIASEHGLLDVTKPLYRCGEVVRLTSNPEQISVVFDYRLTGRIWLYKIRAAHYAKP